VASRRSSSLQISKPELVTLAVGELDGARNPVDTEDVAVRAHGLAPTAFAWRRYPTFVNLELVRVALVDASRPKSGQTVQGRGRGGWLLTDAGVTWYKANRDRLLSALGAPSSGGGATVKQPESAHRERERIRVKGTVAWKKWSAEVPVGPIEGSQVFRVDQYTTTHNRVIKVRALLELFEGDAELGTFLREMAAGVDVPQSGRGDT
jgi:hypothetical protein